MFAETALNASNKKVQRLFRILVCSGASLVDVEEVDDVVADVDKVVDGAVHVHHRVNTVADRG